MPPSAVKGTARWRGVGTIDKEICFAADKVIVVAEIVAESELRKMPESNQIPYFVVDAIVENPLGRLSKCGALLLRLRRALRKSMDAASRNPGHEEVAR